MFKYTKLAVSAAIFTAIFAMTAAAQSATGTVTMNATVSKFVEIQSAGAVTLTGNVGGGVTTDGSDGTPLAVVVGLGELGPSNLSPFVTANVPLRIRSNSAYTMSVVAAVTGSATSAERIVASDIGFGLGAISRTGLGVNAGTDTNATSGDPTAVGNGGINGTTGRYQYTAVRSNLGAFTSATTALSGPQIMKAVPRSNANGLTVPAMFSIKPQFYEDGSTTVAVTFTVTAP